MTGPWGSGRERCTRLSSATEGFGSLVFYRVSLILLIVLFSLTTVQAEPREIVVGLSDNRPMTFMENGEPKGLFIDLLTHVARQEGWTLTYAYDSWETVFDRLEKGDIDLLPAVGWSEARAGRIDYTQKSLLVNWGQVYVGSHLDVDSIEDLRGKRIAIQPNDIHGQHFSGLMETLGIDYTRVFIADYRDIFEALDHGKVHAGVVNKVFASVNEGAFKVRSTPIVFNPIQIRYAVPKGDPAGLLPAMDRHLAGLMETQGSLYQRVMEKWFGHGKLSMLPAWLKEAVLLVISLGLFSLFIILLLRNQVAAKTMELQETNAVLRESEQKLRLHLESTLSVPWEYDLKNQVFSYIGPQAGEVFGYPPESWSDLASWKRKLHPDDRSWAPGYCIRETLKGRDYEVACRLLTPDNRVVWAQGVVTVVTGPDGPERLIGFTRDITESKLAEETLQKSEKRYRQLVENIAELVWEVDGEGLFTYVSPNALDICGIEPDELIGKSPYTIMPVGEMDRIEDILVKNNDVGDTVLKLTHKVLHKEGRCLHFETTGMPFSAPNGDLLGFRGTSIDMTERRKVDAEKMRLETKLQQAQKMETIGTLAGGIAHDFNNLLFPILGHTEMVRDDLPDGSPIKGSLNEIHSAAIRARDLVRQILTFSRQDSHEVRPMKIQPVLKEGLKLIRSTIPATIEINFAIDEACGFIEADSTQIHQVVMNLTTNAYHAMEEEGGVMTVALKEVQVTAHDTISPGMVPGGYVRLTVADTGLGMSHQQKEKIFEPFFTTKEGGKGTGMGLSVVHGIVKSLKGGIQVSTELHKGTEIHVYFPVAAPLASDLKPQPKETIPGGAERILLVDDEETIVDIERQMLERMGYQVATFTSSKDALTQFQADPGAFDLVISDLNMPTLRGDQLAAEIIKIRPGIPILMCTGFSDKITEEKAAARGIKDFLMKPVVMTDLGKKIREVLE